MYEPFSLDVPHDEGCVCACDPKRLLCAGQSTALGLFDSEADAVAAHKVRWTPLGSGMHSTSAVCLRM